MFKLEIKTGGAAFRDLYEGNEDNYYEEQEVAKLLNKIAHEVAVGNRNNVIMDANGNKVGKWSMD